MRPLPRVHAITDTQVLALSDFGARACRKISHCMTSDAHAILVLQQG